MLVLSRKKDESIIINGNIEIVVVGVDASGNVRLGIKAPKDVSIHRKEVYEEIKKSNVEAGNSKIEVVKDFNGII